MHVCHLNKESINEIAELTKSEKEKEEIREFILGDNKGLYMGVYTNNKLVGAALFETKRQVSIFDNPSNKDYYYTLRYFLCSSLKAIPYLINTVSVQYKFRLDPKYTDLEIINKIAKRYGFKLEINYCEDGMIIANTFEPQLTSIRKNLIRTISCNAIDIINVSGFYNCVSFYFTNEEILKNSSFIIREINCANTDRLKMIGETVKYITKRCKVLYGKGTSKYIEALDKNGYREYSDYENGVYVERSHKFDDYPEKYYTLTKRNSALVVNMYNKHTYKDVYYDGGSMSFYRHVLLRHIYEYETKKSCDQINIYNKYGRLFTILYKDTSAKTTISKQAPKNHLWMLKGLISSSEFYENLRNVSKAIGISEYDSANSYLNSALVTMRKLLGEKYALEFLEKFSLKYKKENFTHQMVHDYFFPICELFYCNKFLTKKALEIILEYRIEKISKLKEALTSLSQFEKEGIDVKSLRKEISDKIKKRQSIDETINRVFAEINNQFYEKKRLNPENRSLYDSFIGEMNKYNKSIILKAIFSTFGDSYAKKILSGKCLSVFKEKKINYDLTEVGLFIKKAVLSLETKRAKKLYGVLRKIQSITDIFQGHIEPDNVDRIFYELRQRSITIPEEIEFAHLFSAKVEKKCSPEFLIAGDATVCCMSFGQTKSIQYAKEKGFGILNIYFKNRICANSLIWINDAYDCLVIDNIEVHPNYEKYKGYIAKIYKTAIESILLEHDMSFAVQGTSYSDLDLYEDESKRLPIAQMARGVSGQFYSDASLAVPIISTKDSMEYIMEYIKEINAELKQKYRDNPEMRNPFNVDTEPMPVAPIQNMPVDATQYAQNIPIEGMDQYPGNIQVAVPNMAIF